LGCWFIKIFYFSLRACYNLWEGFLKMSFKRQVAYNTAAQIIGKAIVLILSVFVTILLTRALGPVGYGYYNTAIAFVGFFIILADLGIYPIVVREMAQHPRERAKIYGNAASYRALSAFLIFLIAALLGLLMPYHQSVKLAIVIYAIGAFLSTLINFSIAVFQIHYRMDFPTAADVLGRLLYLLLLVFGLRYDASLSTIFWLFALSAALNLFLNLFWGARYLPPRFFWDSHYLKSFLKESLPMGVVAVLAAMHFKIDTIFLSLFKPAYDVGIYSAAYRVFESLMIIPGVFSGLIFPRLAELYTQDRRAFSQLLQKSFDSLALMVFPVVIIFYFLAPQVIQIVAGEQFSISVIPLRILLVSLFGIYFIGILNYALIAARKQVVLIYLWLFISVLNILLNLILIYRYSYRGAAMATLITEILAALVLLLTLKRFLKIRLNFIYLLKTVVPAVFLFFVFYLFAKSPFLSLAYFLKLSLLLQIVASVVIIAGALFIFLLLLLIFRLISKREILDIIKAKN
jgi:O-antigen/teichoic acid export membrane protein